jgi:hypothetical protein
MPAPILQIKRGAAANIGIASLRAGEPGFTTDKYDFYIGLNGIANDQKFFGSHRYWDREQSGTKALSLKLVSDNGSESINLRSPVSLGSTFTYTLPATGIGNSGKVLSTNESGVLSWVDSVNDFSIGQIISGFGTFTNNVAFTSTTDNTLGNTNTGAVQIDGGLGVDKNVSIGGSLHVQGQSYFVGIVTFAGGTINLGDDNTDNINVGGEFISGLAPNVDNTYDIGISTQRWKDAFFSGIGSFSTGAYIDAVQIGITATNEIDTTSGNLILDSAAGTVEIQDNLTVSGITTLTGLLDANGGASIDNIQIGVTGDNEIDTSTGGLTLDSASGQTIIDDNLSVTGIATITGAFVANGNVTLGDTSGDTITINGTTTFNQPLVGTIGTATRATTVDITDTDAQSGGIVFGSVGTGSTLYNDTDLTYNSNTNVLSVPVVSATTEVRTGSVKAADGATAITITNSTGAVATNNNLTVGGDLFVNGSTTQVNTTTLNVKDALIDLGLIDTGGGVLGVPTSDLNKDIGLLLNYFSTTAKKAAMFWDDSSSRIVFADDATEGAGTLTVTNGNYASIEIESLWVNDCAGQSQVISCTGTERFLENITVDAGTF